MELAADNSSPLTLKQQLSEAGLLDNWIAAALNRDREEMARLLTKIDYIMADALCVASLVLNAPEIWGF
jgi:hypothetical protein